MRRPVLSTVAVAVLVLLGACSSGDSDSSADAGGSSASESAPRTDADSDAEATEGQWVGRVEGTEAFIALVSDGEETRAYVCDGAAIDAWFGAESGSAIEAETAGIALDAARDGDGWAGTVSLPDGTAPAFTAAPSDDDVLFRAAGEDGESSWLGGWIVLDDEQRGSLVVRTATTSTQTSPTLAPSTLTLSGSSTSLVVAPVSPLRLPTAQPSTSTFWTASGRVTRSGSVVRGVSVRFSRSDGTTLGSALTSSDGSYRLSMGVPTTPIVVTVGVLDASARPLRVSAPTQVTTVPNGASTVNITLA